MIVQWMVKALKAFHRLLAQTYPLFSVSFVSYNSLCKRMLLEKRDFSNAVPTLRKKKQRKKKKIQKT